MWLTISLGLFYLHHFLPSYYGTLGDTLGILNSFFSALAFAGIIYSLRQQNKMIRKQEQEIEENRKELRIDRFEAKFFQMLAAQREIVNEIDQKQFDPMPRVPGTSVPINVTRGRECFKIFYDQHFMDAIREEIRREGLSEQEKLIVAIEGFYSLADVVKIFEEQFFPDYESILSHYFRHLYYTVDLVDRAEFLDVNSKREYLGIVRAQLSTYEFLLLFYNGLSSRGAKFKVLMEKYDLLFSMNENLLVNGAREYYDESGYRWSHLR
jgi:hypothetical protein